VPPARSASEKPTRSPPPRSPAAPAEPPDPLTRPARLSPSRRRTAPSPLSAAPARPPRLRTAAQWGQKRKSPSLSRPQLGQVCTSADASPLPPIRKPRASRLALPAASDQQTLDGLLHERREPAYPAETRDGGLGVGVRTRSASEEVVALHGQSQLSAKVLPRIARKGLHVLVQTLELRPRSGGVARDRRGGDPGDPDAHGHTRLTTRRVSPAGPASLLRGDRADPQLKMYVPPNPDERREEPKGAVAEEAKPQ
jgi:hypothetical protein